MEPTRNKMMFWLGDYEVVQSKHLGGITVKIGNGVTITFHLGPNFPHTVREGDKLPLYTEVPYAHPKQSPE